MGMNKLTFFFSFWVMFMASCGGDDAAEPQGPQINNNYVVSTLTEPFPGSGGCTVGKDGFIYVSNFGDELSNPNGTRVRRVDPTTGAVEVYAEGLVGASGSAFDSQGNLFQANISGNSISKITPDGQTTTFVTSGINGPVGVVVDPQDNVFVCNCGGNNIRKLTPDGGSSQFASSSLFRCPNGLTIDEAGNLYAVNFGDSKVIKITPDGFASEFANIPGGQNGHVTRIGNKLYVIARRSNQIYEVALDTQQVTLIAGNGEAGNDDGPASESSFYIPNGIAPSPDGKKLYVVSRLFGQGTPLNPVYVRVIDLIE